MSSFNELSTTNPKAKNVIGSIESNPVEDFVLSIAISDAESDAERNTTSLLMFWTFLYEEFFKRNKITRKEKQVGHEGFRFKNNAVHTERPREGNLTGSGNKYSSRFFKSMKAKKNV